MLIERRAPRRVVPQSSVSTSLYRSATAHKTVESDNLLQASTQLKDKDITTIHNTTVWIHTSSSSIVNKGVCQLKKKTAFKKKKKVWCYLYSVKTRCRITRPRLLWIWTVIILNRYSTETDFTAKIIKLTVKYDHLISIRISGKKKKMSPN